MNLSAAISTPPSNPYTRRVFFTRGMLAFDGRRRCPPVPAMTRASCTLMAVAVLAACAAPPGPQPGSHAAHDEQLGTVHFATSCSAGVSATFDRGVALLH